MAGGRLSLAEIMGKKGEDSDKEFGTDDLQDLLGDGMIKMSFNPLGRVRLLRALKQRFGDGFRNVPGVSGILKDFDGRANMDLLISKVKAVKPEKES